MKTFIAFINGVEVGYIKAKSHNAAEKKARAKYLKRFQQDIISVTYTEV